MKSISLFLTGLLIVISGLTTSILAVKAYPYPMEVKQPNGEKISIHLQGDEYFHYTTAENGCIIVKDDEGYYRFAKISEQGILAPGNTIVSQTMLRSDASDFITPTAEEFLEKIKQPAMVKMMEKKLQDAAENTFFPSSSLRSSNEAKAEPYKMKSLVILVNFKDVKFLASNTNAAFTNLLNQPGYKENQATGSARDYYIDNSNGAFEPEFVVYGPVDLPNNMSYYGGNDTNGTDKNVGQMIIHACNAANTKYPDLNFQDYATDKNGKLILQNVFVFYAGYNEAEGGGDNTVWPQKSNILDYSASVDGVQLATFACTSELQGNSSNSKGMAAIGTFTHEFGHVLGLPDFYDANKSDNGLNAGVGYWSIMDSGNYLNGSRTPPSLSATERYFLSMVQPYINWWNTPTDLNAITSPQTIEISPMTSDKENRSYMYQLFAPNNQGGIKYELFMFENRKQEGWDTYLPGEGMLIFHMDWSTDVIYSLNYGTQSLKMTAVQLWANGLPNLMGSRPLYDLVKANNEQFTMNGSSAIYTDYKGHPFPGFYNKTSISDDTTPNLRFWGNTASELSLSNITRKSDGTISFDMKKGSSATPSIQENQPVVYGQNQAIYFNNLPENASIEIYDISGRNLIRKQITGSQHNELINSSGIYIVKIKSSDGLNLSYKVLVN